MFAPEQFGAVGDGVHDDTVAIQAAIDAIAANGSGLLAFEARPYLIGAPLHCSCPVTMRGIGAGMGPGPLHLQGGSVLLAKSSFLDGNMFSATTNIGIDIEGIRFDAQVQRTSGAAIRVQPAGPAPLINFSSRIVNCGFRLQYDCVWGNEWELSTIERNIFETWAHYGLVLNIDNNIEGGFGFVRNNYFFGINLDGSVSNAFAAIVGSGGYGFIGHNIIVGCQYGLSLVIMPTSVNVGTLLVDHCSFEEQIINSMAVARIPGAPAIFGNLDIADCEFSNIDQKMLDAHIKLQNDGIGDFGFNALIHDCMFSSFIDNPDAAFVEINTGNNVIAHDNVMNGHGHAAKGFVAGGLSEAPILLHDNSLIGFAPGSLYQCSGNVIVNDLTGNLRFADLGAWANGSMCYVGDGQGSLSSMLAPGGTGCLAWRQKNMWATLPITG